MTKILTIHEQLPIMQFFCDMFLVKIVVQENMPSHLDACIDVTTGTIEASAMPRTRDSLVSTMMHEISHLLVAKQGKYKDFHLKPVGDWTKEDAIAYKKIALHAEVYVDNYAEKLTKMYFPDVEYEQCYRTKKSRKHKQKRVVKMADEIISWIQAC
jgi:hypothetical protein